MKLFVWLAYKFVRPNIPISSALAAWIISRMCGADRKTAAAAIAVSSIGASIYHYGALNKVYTRKSEWLELKHPKMVMGYGLVIFLCSVIVAIIYLPVQCVGICIFNTAAIAAYSAELSKHFRTKNLTMAIISATPIVIGWQAAPETHPMVIKAILLAAVLDGI